MQNDARGEPEVVLRFPEELGMQTLDGLPRCGQSSVAARSDGNRIVVKVYCAPDSAARSETS